MSEERKVMVLKICNTCMIKKDSSLFHKDKKTQDGKRRVCKSCVSEYHHTNKEKILQMKTVSWAKYSLENSERLKEKSRRYRKDNADAVSKKKHGYKEVHAPKIAAKNAVQGKIVTGEIMKKPCEICGENKVDGHHDDYAKPLDVRWLCRRHHMAWHAENGEAPNGRALAAHAGQGAKA